VNHALVETPKKNSLVNPRWSCEGIQGLPGELIRIIRDSLGTPGGVDEYYQVLSRISLSESPEKFKSLKILEGL
jgi:hypothetical protein